MFMILACFCAACIGVCRGRGILERPVQVFRGPLMCVGLYVGYVCPQYLYWTEWVVVGFDVGSK